MNKLAQATIGLLLAGSTLLAPATVMSASANTAAATASCKRTLSTYPVLRSGARRPAVRTLQCLLNDAGFGPLTVDGWYGPQTRSAIRDLQETFEGTEPPPNRYRIGRGMWTLIISRKLPDRTLHLGDQGKAVVTLQRALRAGGGTLAVDGDFGSETRAAVRAFQRHNELSATGRVNADTRFWLRMGGITSGTS